MTGKTEYVTLGAVKAYPIPAADRVVWRWNAVAPVWLPALALMLVAGSGKGFKVCGNFAHVWLEEVELEVGC